MNDLKVEVSRNGVFINGTEIPRCSEVKIKIDPIERPEVEFLVTVDEVSVQYSHES